MLRFAQSGAYEPRWSAEILEEVARNLKKGRDASGKEKVERMISLMREHFEDAEVEGYEAIVPAMANDPKDRHVLAAAIVGGADILVTSNARHFPPHSREPCKIDLRGPDEFLCGLWEDGDTDRIATMLRRWTRNFRREPNTLEAILEQRIANFAPNFSRFVLEHVHHER